jgi:glyoxylase-like metal-dependent hydrolase (beta-lactamase superfamily II)
MKTMKERFEKVIGEIYRLKIPFDTVYTSVFLVASESGAVLVDCATTKADVDGYILPALADMGYKITDVKAIVITHNHGDHAGGLSRILHHAPNIKVIREACALFDGLETYPLYGHAREMLGLFDARTGTLISGDGLQGAGVDKYRAHAEDKAAYFATIERVRGDERIENLVFSHAYEPWFEYNVFGRGAVFEALEECKKYIIGE